MAEKKIKNQSQNRNKLTKKQHAKLKSTGKKAAKAYHKMSKGKKIFLTITVLVLIAALVFAAIYYRDIWMSWFAPSTEAPSGDIVLSGGGAEAHFINVGQGTSILMIFEDKTTMLADAGNTSTDTFKKEDARNSLKSVFERLEITVLDYVLATHPDADHTNLLDWVLDSYQVNCTIYNDVPAKDTTQTYNAFREKALAEPESRQMLIGETGFMEDYDKDGSLTSETITGGTSSVTLYAPGYNNKAESIPSYTSNKNVMSPIGIFRSTGMNMMFTGDAEKQTEAWFLRYVQSKNILSASLDIDVLCLGHHGSSTSSTLEFLNFVQAEYAVASAGAGNNHNHPTPSVMERLNELGTATFRTDVHGTILLKSDQTKFGFSADTRAAPYNNSKNRSPRWLTAA